MRLHKAVAALIPLAGLLAVPTTVHAAQSYDNCTGFIDSLPATISTQGTWCMRRDLSTAQTNGQAIHIAANNVTIDCNDFKLGGLAAGLGTSTVGIWADNRLNLTVRHCNLRGFRSGLIFNGEAGGGHVVEDNRFEANTVSGLAVQGNGSIVRRNLVRDTGGSTVNPLAAMGIYVLNSVDVLDNTVSGVHPTPAFANAIGIYTYYNPNGTVAGNRVREVIPGAGGTAYGIANDSSGRVQLRDNDIVGDGVEGSTGLLCASDAARAKGNMINGFSNAIVICRDDGNSL